MAMCATARRCARPAPASARLSCATTATSAPTTRATREPAATSSTTRRRAVTAWPARATSAGEPARARRPGTQHVSVPPQACARDHPSGFGQTTTCRTTSKGPTWPPSWASNSLRRLGLHHGNSVLQIPGNGGARRNLWSATGTRLAMATFTNETASGWQQVNYAACGDHRQHDLRGVVLQSAWVLRDLPRLLPEPGRGCTAPASPPQRRVGTEWSFQYAGTSVFPTDTWEESNYWVDVAFSPGAAGRRARLGGPGRRRADRFPADPGCASASDPDERSPTLACDDGLDDDGDGYVDAGMPAGSAWDPDPGCRTPPGPSRIRSARTDAATTISRASTSTAACRSTVSARAPRWLPAGRKRSGGRRRAQPGSPVRNRSVAAQ